MFQRLSPFNGGAALAALVAFAGLLAGPPAATAQVGPEESAKMIKPAEGLEAALWASEPLVVNPTNMDVDSRGRVWVTEGLNYRTTLHKDQARIADADRVKVLEDTDGDGKADKATVFADKIFPVPMGIAVEERYDGSGKYLGCKVYVGNSPDLLVLEDTDGDDKADKRYPLLTGFGGYDHDHGVHGMTLGPDGKLYFTQGDGGSRTRPGWQFEVEDKSGRKVGNNRLGSTLRVDRDGKNFEILADKHRNDYETSLTSFGEVFTSDNDDDGNRGCRVIHVLDGGSYGYHTPGSPRHWGEDVPGNMPKLVGTGNGSPSGIMVYEGGHLAKEYQGGVLEAEAGTRQINFFPLTRHGASFRTEPRVMLGSDDPWFRPVDMCAAPDGSVLVADWYDSAVGGHAFRDQTTGRIYRVSTKGKKSEKAARHDFGSVRGLVAALRSPAVATRDAARRGLIEHAGKDRQGVESALVNLFSSGEPHERARALWTLHAVAGDKAAERALKDTDPRIREQAVRILGRDDRENGHVEYIKSDAKSPPPASGYLDSLRPLASDPDAGVRRELILALRNVPTGEAGEALKTLARAWDGRDRWYLESLGLALEKRESEFIAGLFDGTLYGDLDLDEAGQSGKVALPPFFPVDRNEAFIAVGAPDAPVSALSKTLGLAWRLHRAEVLPELGRVLPKLASPELQQAADDVLGQMRDPRTAVVLAEIGVKAGDPARQRQILATLAGKLDTAWGDARKSPEIVSLTEAALKDPELRLEAVGVAAATGDPRYAPAVLALARDAKASPELKAAAVEAAARIGGPEARELIHGLIDEARGKKSSSPTVEAAVRSLARLGGDPKKRLLELIDEKKYPLGLRREALRAFSRLDGGKGLLALARDKKVSDDLKTEASSLLGTNPDRNIRSQAAGVLPQPKGRGGRALPSFFEMVRKEGQADRGRDVFFRAGSNSCSGCHRIQGRGQWVGPDLSTIGAKYGRDELLRSILNPSAAIGHNYRSLVVGLDDGRVLTGLPVDETPDRLVLKTAEGERVAVRPKQIEERKESDVSLMPEGLAETMTDQELADLLSFLSSLRQPVSIVGQYHVIGPLAEAKDAPAFDPTVKVDLASNLRGPEGQKLSWRRLDANAESLADLGTLVGDAPSKSAYVYAPVVSAIRQQARLVLDTKADIKVWLDGKPLALPDPSDGQSRTLLVDLPRAKSDLLIRVAGGPSLTIVTTLVTDRPVSFRTDEEKVSGR
ncbi:MAG: HEAT repeat domain-containing protein [Planctomycetia bacterium]|nr:HEAT repeat domain-containing protein [Planctomycetia bacterium]